jgi:RNA polymerase sigma-70 factor (ECF subfamily)
LIGVDDLQSTSVAELLYQTGKQDQRAFSRLYRITSPKLYAIALRILKDQGAANDCLQESFLSIWRQAHSYVQVHSSPMTWLSTIVRNRAIDMLRKQLRRESRLSYGDTTIGVFQEQLIDSIALQRCLSTMEPSQVECLILAYLEGLTHPELSRRLNLPLGTVKSWIRRGLQQLRNCLQK